MLKVAWQNVKTQLINKLFNEFEKDKLVIRLNLLKVMDEVILETKDNSGKITMTIKYERTDFDGKTK